jgi:CubicO group peptidase (beta-lactamase class C family)
MAVIAKFRGSTVRRSPETLLKLSLTLLTLAVCLLSAPRSQGGSPALPLATPTEAGMSAAVLNAGVGLFREALETDDLRGAVLLVARHGKVVLHEAVGWRDKENRLPMERDTLFRMASNTKPVVAAAILMLADEKKLSLDDNVRRYIPSFDNYRAGSIKIKHLLSHTSGMRIPVIFYSPLIQRSADHPNAPSLVDEVSRFGEVGAEFPPGTTYSYNNPGFNTLGAIVEIVSGQPLENFLRERIYEPLGMTVTSNHESKSPAEKMSVVYERKDGQWSVKWKPGDEPDYPFVRASGGMISSAADYVRFCQMFLNGGEFDGKRLLAEASVRVATFPHTRALYSEDEQEKMNSFYGYGWQVYKNGVFAHGGSDGTFAWVDPNNGLIGVVFTQSPGGKIPRSQFMKVVEAALHAPSD